MPSATDLLLAVVAADPGRPRVTWYDDATGERVELSGATLLTWVAKTAHLLSGDLGAGDGAQVVVDLPRHWTAAVWWLAVDAVGAELLTATSDHAPDVAVVGPDRVTGPPEADEVVAVSLRPMGAPFAEPLPPLVHDFAAEVRAQPDAFPFVTGRSTASGEAAVGQARAWRLHPSDRLLVTGTPLDVPTPVTDLFAALAADASVVWVRNPELPLDVERLVAEQVTAVVDARDRGPAEPTVDLVGLPWPSGFRVLVPGSLS